MYVIYFFADHQIHSLNLFIQVPDLLDRINIYLSKKGKQIGEDSESSFRCASKSFYTTSSIALLL